MNSFGDDLLIARLTPQDATRLASGLKEAGMASTLSGIYWLPVAENMLNALQREHLPDCGPYVLALNLDEEGVLLLEPLVRAQNRLHCECIALAEETLLEQAALQTLNLLAGLDIHPLPEICQA